MSLTGRIKKAAKAFNKDDEFSERDLLTPKQRQGEEAMLAKIMSEIESGQRRKGVWAKAVMDSEGDEAKAESLYLKYAVQSLVDEWTIEAVKRQKEEEKSNVIIGFSTIFGAIVLFIISIIIMGYLSN